MAMIVVAHRPDLTVQEAVDVFRGHFVGTYEVYKPRVRGWPAGQFVVKKTAWVGVGVDLWQREGQTAFWIMPTIPWLAPAGPLGCVLMPFLMPTVGLLLRSGWTAMMYEIRRFIENASAFK